MGFMDQLKQVDYTKYALQFIVGMFSKPKPTVARPTSTAPSNQQPIADPAPPMPSATAPTPSAFELEAFEAEVFKLTNQFRVENGKKALAHDSKLSASAEKWAMFLAAEDKLVHSTPSLIEQNGYAWSSWAENIAGGQSTPYAVVEAWKNSPGHRANMLSDKVQDIGIGYYFRGKTSLSHFWVQIFGTKK